MSTANLFAEGDTEDFLENILKEPIKASKPASAPVPAPAPAKPAVAAAAAAAVAPKAAASRGRSRSRSPGRANGNHSASRSRSPKKVGGGKREVDSSPSPSPVRAANGVHKPKSKPKPEPKVAVVIPSKDATLESVEAKRKILVTVPNDDKAAPKRKKAEEDSAESGSSEPQEKKVKLSIDLSEPPKTKDRVRNRSKSKSKSKSKRRRSKFIDDDEAVEENADGESVLDSEGDSDEDLDKFEREGLECDNIIEYEGGVLKVDGLTYVRSKTGKFKYRGKRYARVEDCPSVDEAGDDEDEDEDDDYRGSSSESESDSGSGSGSDSERGDQSDSNDDEAGGEDAAALLRKSREETDIVIRGRGLLKGAGRRSKNEDARKKAVRERMRKVTFKPSSSDEDSTDDEGGNSNGGKPLSKAKSEAKSATINPSAFFTKEQCAGMTVQLDEFGNVPDSAAFVKACDEVESNLSTFIFDQREVKTNSKSKAPRYFPGTTKTARRTFNYPKPDDRSSVKGMNKVNVGSELKTGMVVRLKGIKTNGKLSSKIVRHQVFVVGTPIELKLSSIGQLLQAQSWVHGKNDKVDHPAYHQVMRNLRLRNLVLLRPESNPDDSEEFVFRLGVYLNYTFTHDDGRIEMQKCLLTFAPSSSSANKMTERLICCQILTNILKVVSRTQDDDPMADLSRSVLVKASDVLLKRGFPVPGLCVQDGKFFPLMEYSLIKNSVTDDAKTNVLLTLADPCADVEPTGSVSPKKSPKKQKAKPAPAPASAPAQASAPEAVKQKVLTGACSYELKFNVILHACQSKGHYAGEKSTEPPEPCLEAAKKAISFVNRVLAMGKSTTSDGAMAMLNRAHANPNKTDGIMRAVALATFWPKVHLPLRDYDVAEIEAAIRCRHKKPEPKPEPAGDEDEDF